MHNPTPSFAEEQILFSPLKQNAYKTIAECIYFTFSYTVLLIYHLAFLRSGHLLKMSMCHDATTRALIEFHALSGAGIN